MWVRNENSFLFIFISPSSASSYPMKSGSNDVLMDGQSFTEVGTYSMGYYLGGKSSVLGFYELPISSQKIGRDIIGSFAFIHIRDVIIPTCNLRQ